MIPIILIGGLAMIVFIVFINNAERKIPVQYAKRMVGRKMYGGQSTHIPMKVSMSGVMPVIFAQSIASLPATIGAFAGWTVENSAMMRLFDTSKPFYSVLYFFLIVGFSYFYSSMSFNPVEVANNLKKNGGFIPGFRPGKPTADFITKVLNKITMFGALYLSVIAILPIITGNISGWWYKNVFSSSSVTYLVIYGLMIFFFSWFYSQIQYDPVEISNNLKKNGGFIPGFRPGKPTADFIKKVIAKIVIFGAVYLAVVAMLPMIAGAVTGTSLAIGGTSIIIVVGVALETVKALEAQMLMRHYKGFLE